MITVDYKPIEVDLNIEQGSIIQSAFYTVGFITENDSAPRTVVVNSLQDLLDNGYERGSNAYNFCKAVLIQEAMNTVIVRAKRASETYFEAYEADHNTDYYYVVLGTKVISEVLDFNTLLIATKELKLQFFSTKEDVSDQVVARRLVYYFQEEFEEFNYINFDSSSNVLLDSSSALVPTGANYEEIPVGSESRLVTPNQPDLSLNQAQARNIKYPEAAWIGLCGNSFPSKIQWLYKRLQNVTTSQPTTIPDYSSTSVLMNMNLDKATVGSGSDCTGNPIHEVVSLNWVEYAIQKKLWEVFYNVEKVPNTNSGLLLLENAVKYVLDIAVSLNIFSEYKITGSKRVSSLGRASFTFEATLTQTILEVKKVEGTIYH